MSTRPLHHVPTSAVAVNIINRTIRGGNDSPTRSYERISGSSMIEILELNDPRRSHSSVEALHPAGRNSLSVVGSIGGLL
jgi:hypothetical protein